MYREDIQDKNDWRLRIKGESGNPDLPGKWTSTVVCVCIVFLYLNGWLIALHSS